MYSLLFNPVEYRRNLNRIQGTNIFYLLTLILLTWRIWWAPNIASRWQMGFNSALKGLKYNKSPACFDTKFVIIIRQWEGKYLILMYWLKDIMCLYWHQKYIFILLFIKTSYLPLFLTIWIQPTASLSSSFMVNLTLRRLMSYIYIYIWSTHSWCF